MASAAKPWLDQGMRLACHAEDLAVMGLTEVFHKIPTIWAGPAGLVALSAG